MNNKSYYHHKKKITKICHTAPSYRRELRFNHLSYNKSRYNGLGSIIIEEIKKLSNHNKISILWLLCSMDKQKTSNSPIVHKIPKTRHNCYSYEDRHSQEVPHSHRRNGCKTSAARRSTYAYNVEILSQNFLLKKFKLTQLQTQNLKEYL